jgi:hypothetical protein
MNIENLQRAFEYVEQRERFINAIKKFRDTKTTAAQHELFDLVEGM